MAVESADKPFKRTLPYSLKQPFYAPSVFSSPYMSTIIDEDGTCYAPKLFSCERQQTGLEEVTNTSIFNPMLTLSLYLSSFLLISAAAGDSPPYTPTDYILLNCGSSSNSTSPDGRNWDGDASSKFYPSNTHNTSSASTASQQDPSVTQVPYMTARIFHSQFTYTFPVSPGPKFLRLYFYPATYSGFDLSNSFFSVTSGDAYTLLSNFSAFLTVAAMKPQAASFIKEFCINVRDNQRLTLTFHPSPNSYAFVNGIEVVSMPNNLYTRGEITFVDQLHSLFDVENNTALETVHRLNVGGNDVPVTGDTGMFRMWGKDDNYIYGGAFGVPSHRDFPILYTPETPAYTAPAIVYTTSRTMGDPSYALNYNLTWTFPVDSGFRYLLRLHFCEHSTLVTVENRRVFWIFIHNQTAEKDADIINWSGGNRIPVYKDYVVLVPNADESRGKQDLWLALHPNMESKPEFADAILNGLEIFKLNQSDGNLAGPNPEPVVSQTPPGPYSRQPEKSKSKGSSPLIVVTGAVVGGLIALISLSCFFIIRRRRRVKDPSTTDSKSSWVPFSHTSRYTNTNASSLPSDLCRHFSLAEIKSATWNFDDTFVIGAGGFGNVYRGFIDDGTTTVAIKRLNPSSKQGAHEFQTEIKMLSMLRHRHLVSLIGYCDDEGEMILVYDYMAHGTLRDHLYKTKNPPLPWKKRLQICIGAARGLHYLHTGANHTIIHRDVKSTNILLDGKWVAKVSDFGLSKVGPTSMSQTHVSTVVKGSFGYVDPEYYRLQQLTEKSDVYSFGVVLFEVLCARPALIPGIPNQQVSLAVWARYCYRKGALEQIMDPHLRAEIEPECLKKFGEIADSCLRDQGIERPTMGDVVGNLEFALQLQETAENINGGCGVHGVGVGHIRMNVGGTQASPSVPGGEVTSTTTDDDDVFTGSPVYVSDSRSSGTSTVISSGGKSVGSCDPDRVVSGSVFSEIMNPKGR